jgi:hypothetical protein
MENKKLIKTVSKAVSKGVKEVNLLKTKGQNAIKKAKKEFAKIKPAEKAVGAGAKKAIKKIERGGNKLVKASIQLEKDIEKGIKLGLKK